MMSKPALSLTTLPELAGWMTLGEAAKALGISNERIRQMATSKGAGRLKTAHQIGKRPIGIVREAEILAIIERRKAALAAGQSPAPEDMPDEGNLRSCAGVARSQPSGRSRAPCYVVFRSQSAFWRHGRGHGGV